MTTTPPRRSWANTTSKNVLHNYDQSPVDSPPRRPSYPRHGSTASIDSTKSEPAMQSNRHMSAPNIPESGSLRRERHDNVHEPSANSHHSHKKSGLKVFFSKRTEEEKRAEKMKRSWTREKERLEVKKYENETRRRAHAKANAAKNKGIDRDANRDVTKHPRPKTKTAGITTYTGSSAISAPDQEARYPHSGRPSVVLNDKQDNPELTRIESQDQPDDEVDTWQKTRIEWNEEHEDNLGDILEIRSRQASRVNSPWATPGASREPSPNRLWAARPSIGSKRNSWHGAYTRDPISGRWSRNTSPSQRTSPGRLTPINPAHEGVDADLLAKSLAERLKMTA